MTSSAIAGLDPMVLEGDHVRLEPLSLDLRGGALAVEGLMARTRLLEFAPSFGDVATTWTYPTRTSHRRVPVEEQAAMGIGPGLVRVSVGLEDVNELMADLDQALGR